MADPDGHGLVIFRNKTFTRLETNLFKPIESSSNVTVNKETIKYNLGILGMALSPKQNGGQPRMLFFRPLASHSLYFIRTDELKNLPFSLLPLNFGVARDILTSQSVGQAFTPEGTLFLGMTRESGIACWNMHNALSPENFVRHIFFHENGH